jgi:hypothetical protein
VRLRDLVRDRAVWIYAAVVAVLFHRPLTTETFFFRDLYQLFYPKKVLLAEALRAGVLPLWDPFTHGGQPYLASPANFTLHPSNVLYVVLPVLAAFNLVLVLHVLFCAVAAYWLGRTLGLSTPAAFVTGTVYALAGSTLSTANLIPILLGLPWVPLTIGLTHRALRDRRSLAPAAIAAALPLIGGAAELTGMMFATLLVWIFVVHRRIVPSLVVMAFGVGLSLVQTLPATSVMEQSSRGAKRTYESFTSWSLHPLRLPELAIPRFFGPIDRLDEPSYWGRGLETSGFPYILSIYLGIPALLLAMRGAFEPGLPRVLAVLALLAIALALGRWLPGVRLVYDYVPLVTIFRFPVKAMLAALLPVAVLAGFGLDSRLLWRRTLIAAGAVLLAVLTVPALQRFELQPEHRTMLIVSFVHAAVATLAFVLARTNAQKAAVVLLDLAIAGFGVNTYAPRSLFAAPPLARQVGAMIGDGRFYAAPRELLLRAPENDVKWLARWNLATLNDYSAGLFRIPVTMHTDFDGLAPSRIVTLSRVVKRAAWPPRLAIFDRAGVRAFATPDALPGGTPIRGTQLHLHANPSARMARFVSSVDVARDDRDALRRIASSRDLSRVVLFESRTDVGKCGSAEVRIVRSNTYEVDAPCRGYVVFAETFYDGWSAKVDGRDAALVRADYAFSAVAVEKGRHAIERRYVPPRLGLGIAGTLLSAALLVLLRKPTS